MFDRLAHLKLQSKVLTQFVENANDEEYLSAEEKAELKLAKIELENVNEELEKLLS
jgi:hypothetical protein